MAKKLKIETLVGLFLLIGIGLIGGGIVYIGDFKSSEKKQYTIQIIYKDSAGLIKGSNIRLGGAAVGVVGSQPRLNESGTGVILEARINKGIQIQRGSEFRIDMQNLLGDKYIDIVPPKTPVDDYIQPGEVIRGHSDSDIAKIRENAVAVSTELANLLKKLEENSDGLVQTVDEISTAAKEISEATHRINTGVLSDKNLSNLEKILGHIEEGSREVPGVITEAKTSLKDMQATMADARNFIGAANQRLEQIDAGIAQIEPAMKAFKTSADNISKMTTDLNSGKGTLGLLINDQKFRNEFEMFIRNLRDYGILRYRNPNEPEPLADPRAGYSGSRR